MMSDPYGRATSEAGDFDDEDNYLDRAAELKAKITAYGGSPTPDVINNLLTAQLVSHSPISARAHGLCIAYVQKHLRGCSNVFGLVTV